MVTIPPSPCCYHHISRTHPKNQLSPSTSASPGQGKPSTAQGHVEKEKIIKKNEGTEG
jgi:hypothetical protein